MLPILLSLGPVKIYSYGLFLCVGLFIALYFWWKMGRDEHFDEIALFDGFFLSTLVYFVVGRVGYVLFHFDKLGTIYRTLAVLAFPGVNSVIGILAVMAFLILFARSHDWDSWKVADSFAVSLSIILVMTGIGGLLNGTHPGYPASWGLIYPGFDSPVIPVDLFIIFWSFLTFAVVSRVRKNFRFYVWYKGESSMAREGLATLIFLTLVGIYFMIAAWLSPSAWKLGPVPSEFVAGILITLTSAYVISQRVGRRDDSVWSKLRSIIRRK